MPVMNLFNVLSLYSVCFYDSAGLYDVLGFAVCLYKTVLFYICQSFTNISKHLKGSVLPTAALWPRALTWTNITKRI